MSEIRLYYRENGRIKISRDISFLKKNPLENFVWIDLNDVNEEIESQLEDFLKIYIQEEEEIEEIEISSRYVETADTIIANSNFLLDNFEKEPVSFILKNNILISVRSCELKSFHETTKKMAASPKNYVNGFQVFTLLLETRVELDADMIEDLTSEVKTLSQTMIMKDIDEGILISIKNLQEKTMLLRENIIDKHRVVSNMLRSEMFPNELYSKLSMVIKDINSLLDHTKFNFDRLDYLQDTYLGLINIEQNKIIKIFTVVTVIFMPPTLIGTIYGMNFKYMPEIEWQWGYGFCLLFMVVSSVLILWFFKKKKWL